MPAGIAVDRNGTIYVVDFGFANPSVISVNPDTGAAHTISSDSGIGSPTDLALSGGSAFVTTGDGILRVSLSSGAQHSFVIGHGLSTPAGIVRSPSGNFLVADQDAARLFSVSRKTGRVRVVSSDLRLEAPFGVGIGLDGFDYVSDFRAKALFRISPRTGTAKSVIARGRLDNPLGVAVVPR
jgi:DNA-binding beta-propeller fold protein YncE